MARQKPNEKPDEIEELDDPKAWDRQKGESKKAYAAFLDYCSMGVARSIRKLHAIYIKQATSEEQAKPPTDSLSTLFSWSAKQDWDSRSADWDEEKRNEADREWKSRQAIVREADWEQSDKLRGLAEKILSDGPNYLKTRRKFIKGRDGQPDREIITVGLNAELAIKALDLASKLQRLSSGLPNNVSATDLTTGGGALDMPKIFLPTVADLADPESDDEDGSATEADDEE